MCKLEGKRVKIIILGCRTNQYEGEAIAASLERVGAVVCDENPHIIVFVTCTITAEADRKCRKLIRHARRENPNSIVAVCGCYVQKTKKETLLELGVDIALGNRLKYMLPEILQRDAASYPIFMADCDIKNNDAWDLLSLDRPRLHLRAFLKVQDGCSHYCSYCIVPYVRGKPVSKDINEVLKEAESIVTSGCPEIILTGVHLGLYYDLPLLVQKIGTLKGLKRLRFGSVEPFAVSDKLLSVLSDTPSFCPHLHLPLQSGDDKVLFLMKRGYTACEFAKIAEKARKALGDDLHISTDLMVGFPEEDDVSFANSIGFVKQIGFGKIHVFPYSPREGTLASSWKRPFDSVVKTRMGEALLLADTLHASYCKSWIGKEVTVLVEENVNDLAKGLMPHYVRVCSECDKTQALGETKVVPYEFCDGVLNAAKQNQEKFDDFSK